MLTPHTWNWVVLALLALAAYVALANLDFGNSTAVFVE